MCFQTGLKSGESVRVTDVRWEGVPEVGGRSAECPAPHGDQAGGWYSELNGRGGPESAGGCVGVQEFTDVWRGEVVEGLEGEEQNLEMDAGFDREPVKLLKDRSDVMMRAAEFWTSGPVEAYGWT